MRISTRTVYGQLTTIYNLFSSGKLEYHPLEDLLGIYHDAIEELDSAKKDLDSMENIDEKDFDDEELDSLIEYIEELENRRDSYWRKMMELFVLDNYFYQYIEW